jgi:hypothetical protein
MNADDHRTVFIMDKRLKFPRISLADLYRAAVAVNPFDDDHRPGRAFKKAARRKSREYARSLGEAGKWGDLPNADLTLMSLGRLAKEHEETYYVEKYSDALKRDRNVTADRPERPRNHNGESQSDSDAVTACTTELREYLATQSLSTVVECGTWQVPKSWLDDLRYCYPLGDPDDFRTWIGGALDGDPHSIGQVLYAFEVCNHRYDF